MTAITIELPDDVAERLGKEAEQHNLTVQQFIESKVSGLVSQTDPEFRRRLNAILAEDHELLRRLA